MAIVVKEVNRHTVVSVVVLSIRENAGIDVRTKMTKQFYRNRYTDSIRRGQSVDLITVGM